MSTSTAGYFPATFGAAAGFAAAAFAFGLVGFALPAAASELASLLDADLSAGVANARARSSERSCAFSFCFALRSGKDQDNLMSSVLRARVLGF